MAAMLAEIKSRMLLPRPAGEGMGEEEDPRAELVRRLQEYERFKKAAEDIDVMPRVDRDLYIAGADFSERQVVKVLPDLTLAEMLAAFKDVLSRASMFAHHKISRERLSVRQRMTDVLSLLHGDEFVEFLKLFTVEEGRMGVTVTFIAVLELTREGLIELVQAEVYGALHVRAGRGTTAANDDSALAAS